MVRPRTIDKRPAVVDLACITSDADFGKDLIEVTFTVIRN